MKSARQKKILELIKEKDIETQEGILQGLTRAGFTATQATVSRDIKELHLVKTLSAGGKYHYVATGTLQAKISAEKYHSILSEALVHVDATMNLVVVKCNTGMAQAACACLDKMAMDEVVGTLAGDDTVFVAMRSAEASVNLVKELKRYIHG